MIKNKIQAFWQNRLVKSVIVVASGTAGAQVIAMVFIPFITRTFGPETYGVLGSFIALVSILTALGGLSYPVAIVLPESDYLAKALIKLSLIIAISITFFIFIIFWLMGGWIIPILGAEDLMPYMYFIPILVFITVCQDIAQQWLIRKKAFKSIAHISIAHSFLNYGSQALVGLYAPIASALISIHILAIAIRAAITGYIGKKIANIPITKNKEKISLTRVAYEYRDFPLYRAPQAVLNTASQSMPILILASFFGSSVAGFYTLTRTVLALPSILLGSSVQSVFYPHFNEAVLERKKTLPLLIKATAALAAIGVWPFLIIILFGPFLFKIIFGEMWVVAGQYAQWLSVWLFFGLINRPSVSSIPVFRIQRWFLGYEVCSIILRIIAISIGFFHFSSAIAAVAMFSIVGAFLNLYLIVVTFLAAKKFDQEQVII